MTETNYGVSFPHRPTKHVDKLPILLSCRVRLNEEQRNTLKTAYRTYKENQTPDAGGSFGGSSIRTVTAQQVPSLVNGWSDLVINDLITSRDSIPLTAIIQIQKALSVEVITGDDIMKAAEGYVSYCFNFNSQVNAFTPSREPQRL